MDPNALVSLVLFGSVPVVVIVRSRAKRADRRRDAREAAERAARESREAGSGPSLY